MREIRQIVIAPDSFKGTMEASQVCRIIQGSARQYFPDAAVRCIPMADGGEGMVDAYLKLLGGRKVLLSVQGLQGRPVACYYGILPDGTAVMEMAACAGLPLLDGALDPMHTTTYGVGEMLLHAEHNGVRRVLLGIGGSATVDCGLGMAAALGYRFLNKDGAAVEAVTCHMAEIAAIVPPARKPALDIIAACDVDNPLCGETGAIYTFGKQKGISEEMMPEMDARMKHFAQVLTRHTGVEVLDVPGAGAAGGMGAALLAFLHAKLQPGVELLLDAALTAFCSRQTSSLPARGASTGKARGARCPWGWPAGHRPPACRALRCAVLLARVRNRCFSKALQRFSAPLGKCATLPR